jgi:hypothetical protein
VVFLILVFDRRQTDFWLFSCFKKKKFVFVQVLRQVQTIKLEDVVLGQYTRSEDGSKPGYLDDETVPKVFFLICVWILLVTFVVGRAADVPHTLLLCFTLTTKDGLEFRSS